MVRKFGRRDAVTGVENVATIESTALTHVDRGGVRRFFRRINGQTVRFPQLQPSDGRRWRDGASPHRRAGRWLCQKGDVVLRSSKRSTTNLWEVQS